MASDKKYYWLKLKYDFFEDDTIQFIEEQTNGVLYVNFYLKLCLKALKTNGTLIRLVGETLIPYDVTSLSKLTNTDIDTVRVAMELFKQIGLIKIYDSGEIYLTQIREMVGTETDSAIRKRKSRAKALECDNVTNVSQICHTEIEKEKELEKELEKEKEKKESFASVIASYTTNQELIEALKCYVEMRQKMKGFTVRALKMNLNELDKLSFDDSTKIAIVNQSICKSWKSFYKLKQDKEISREESGFAF